MANSICVNNFLLADRALSVQSKLNTASRLRLYSTNKVPAPADALAAYAAIEATFDGYSVKTLNPNWLAPVKILDGLYRVLSAVQNYPSPAVTPNTLYGLFIDDNAGNLLAAFQFDVAIVYSVGAPALSVQIGYDVWTQLFGP